MARGGVPSVASHGLAAGRHISQGEHFAQIQQWAEMDDEALRIEDANEQLQQVSDDDEVRRELEAKYPQIMAAWPGRTK